MTAKHSALRKRIPTGIAIVVALVLTGTVTSVIAAGTDSNADTRGVVLFVGDSNVTISAMHIVWRTTVLDHYDDAYVPILASRIGATIRTHDCRGKTPCSTNNFWQIKLRNVLSKIEPDAIVNNLGINDAVRVGTQSSPGYSYYGKKIDWFMHLIPKSKPVYWTNLPCVIEPGSLRKGCQAVNAALGAAHARWPNFVLVNWAARANQHPEYLVRWKGKPDVHMSATGAAAWIALVTSAMDARMPSN